MNFLTKKSLLNVVTTALVISSTSAMAFNPFDVTETSVPGAAANVISNAGKIVGGYTEFATFSNQTAIPGQPGFVSGDFTTDIVWNAGQFFDAAGTTSLPSQLGGFGASGYEMYALFSGLAGTFITEVATGKSTLTFAPGGSLALYIDQNSDTTFGGGVTATGGTADDYKIATGTGLSGVGLLDPTLPTCNTANNCGSFGFDNSFILTTVADVGVAGATPGTAYFTAPDPFYNVSFEGGQFNNFDTTSTTAQLINGSLDAAFRNVPEPTSIALMGLGLLGLAASRRKQTK